MMNDAQRRRCLIVDDFSSMRRCLAKFLERHGWDAIEVEDSVGAHPFMHSGTFDPPDVYLIDLSLTGGLGSTIIRMVRFQGIRVRATGLPVRVIAMTGLDQTNPEVEAAKLAGADEILFKPIDLDRLLKVIGSETSGDVPIPAPVSPSEILPP